MNKLDKKQIPQFAALCVLSAGAFGYFVMKIVTPSPAAAGTRPRPTSETLQVSSPSPTSTKQAETGKAGTDKVGTAPDAAPAGDGAEAPAPTPGMRDPFVVGYVDPNTPPALPAAAPTPKPVKASVPIKTASPQVASIREVAPASATVPTAPILPFGLRGSPVLGATAASAPKEAAAPAAPAWTVTGVLQGEAGQMAVLRSGEARRIVRTGDFVDSLYRVVAVTRSAVVLRHGTTFYHLTLGAAKPAAAAPALPTLPPASVATPMATPDLTPAPKPVSELQVDALAPAGRPVGLEAGLVRMVQGALLMARSYMTPAQTQTDTCFASFHAPNQEAAQMPLDLSRSVYGSGQAAGGSAQWRCALAVADLDASNEAGKLPDRFI